MLHLTFDQLVRTVYIVKITLSTQIYFLRVQQRKVSPCYKFRSQLRSPLSQASRQRRQLTQQPKAQNIPSTLHPAPNAVPLEFYAIPLPMPQQPFLQLSITQMAPLPQAQP